MRKILNRMYILVEGLCKIMMALQVLVTAYVVVGRYVFNRTPVWGEQLTLLFLVWLGMLSAAITLRENTHIRVTLIETFLPAKIVKALDLFGEIVLFLFFLGLFVSGFLLTQQTVGALYPGLGISKAWLYASVPVACVFLIIAVTERGFDMLRDRSPKKGGDIP